MASSADGDRPRWGYLSLWILLIVVMGNYRPRSPGELWGSSAFDWQVKLEIAGWAVLGLAATVGVIRGRFRSHFLKSAPILWVAVLAVFGILSSLYSPAPAYTLFRALQLAIALTLVLMAGLDHDFLYQALAAYVLLTLAAFTLERVAPGLFGGAPGPGSTGPWRLRSVFNHPSYLGIGSAVGAAGLWARWLESRLSGSGFALLIVFIGVTLATVSRTAIAGMLAAMALATLLSAKVRGYTVASWFLLLASAIELTTGSISRFLGRNQTAWEFTSLTGRTEVWTAVLERFPQSGLLGEGLGATRYLPVLDIVGMGHSHNMYLEALITLGVTGVVLVTLILVTWTFRQFRFHFHGHGKWTIGVVNLENLSALLPLAAFCLLDNGFLSLFNPIILIYLASMRLTQEDYLLSAAAHRT